MGQSPLHNASNNAALKELLDDILFPYQRRFLLDTSRFCAWVASRQIGKSFTLGWKALIRACSQSRRHQTIVSAGRDQAKEVIGKVKLHAELIRRVLNEEIVASETKFSVTLVNGSVIRALAANPRTARGYTGDVYLDEFAHVQQDKALWAAILPAATRGKLTVTAVSTPLGDNGSFFKLCHPAPGTKIQFSVHKTTVHDARAAGLDVDVEALRDQYDDDTWAQEFECAFLGHVASYLPWDLLRACLAGPETELERTARIEHASTFLGVDIGRKRDITALSLLRKWPETTLWMDDLICLHKKPFQEQEEIIGRVIRANGVERCCIDATGMGMHLAENLQREFGGVVIPVTFTRGSKIHLATQVRKTMEQGHIKLLNDGPLLADCHAIERRITSNGNIVFDATRNELGHADRFWSLALGLEAARHDASWSLDVEGDGGFDIADPDHIDNPGLRAPTAYEMGFHVVTSQDLEDARDDLMGSRRAADGHKTFTGTVPPKCVLPTTLTRELTAKGEDPCWTCEADRRICEGRPIDMSLAKKTGPPGPSPAQLMEGRDMLREACMQMGHVPPGCRAGGKMIWERVTVAADPCSTCNMNRLLCGGRPQKGAAAA